MRRQVIENAYYAGGARFPPSTVCIYIYVRGGDVSCKHCHPTHQADTDRVERGHRGYGRVCLRLVCARVDRLGKVPCL